MRTVVLVCLAGCLLSGSDTVAARRASSDTVYVIPIQEMIERGLVYVVRRGVAEAVSTGASAIVFDMNTPGGRLDAAEEIVHIIGSIRVPTLTFVNRDAISAGAIIAMGTDRIYMAPGSRIGDAMPLMLSPFGSPQEMSEAMEEKAVSYVAGLIRSAAARKGHDPKLAEAMVRRDVGYRIGDDEVCPKGQLLTLTNAEAEQIVERSGKKGALLSCGTVADIDELLRETGHAAAVVRRLAITPAERIARYIEMLSALFLIGGLLGIYVEFKTPGFGLPGIAGIVLLAIWFWGHHVAGLAGMGELLLLLLGLALILLEVLVIPGFGVAGVAGIVLLAAALMMAMVQHYPADAWYTPPAAQVQAAVIKLGVSLLGSFLLILLIARFLPGTFIVRRLALAASLAPADASPSATAGESRVGLRGVAETALRPAGIGIFADRRLNVVTRGEFVDRGQAIVVAEVHGNRIVVERVADGASAPSPSRG
jgi:membrane-bound serine protease (ClpP class)